MYECNRIDYFTKEEYSPDPNDSTLAIPCKLCFFVFSNVISSEKGEKQKN